MHEKIIVTETITLETEKFDTDRLGTLRGFLDSQSTALNHFCVDILGLDIHSDVHVGPIQEVNKEYPIGSILLIKPDVTENTPSFAVVRSGLYEWRIVGSLIEIDPLMPWMLHIQDPEKHEVLYVPSF